MSEFFSDPEPEVTPSATPTMTPTTTQKSVDTKTDEMRQNTFYLEMKNLSNVSIIKYTSVTQKSPWWLPLKDPTHTISTIMCGLPYGNNSRVVIVLVLKNQYNKLEHLLNSQYNIESIENLTGDVNGIIYNSRAKFCVDDYFSKQPIISYNHNGNPDCINIDISCKEDIIMLVYKIEPFS